MTHSFDRMLEQDFHGQNTQEVLHASPAALRGVSAADAQALAQAFGIQSIRDLAHNVFFRRAQAILAATGSPGFDPGPPPAWETFLGSAPLAYYAQHPAGRFRLDFGPVYYRGRLDGTARLLVVGQDPSTNEILAQRIFVGKSGQRVQGFLNKLGLRRSYTMLNTFLFSVFGQFDTTLQHISLEEPILAFRNAFLDMLVQQNPLQAILAVGRGAQHAIQHWPGHQHMPVVAITHPAAPNEADLLANWNAGLAGLQGIVDPDDGSQPEPVAYGSSFQPHEEVAIPRCDLPFGLPAWHGVGGHSDRDGAKKIIWMAP
jgi:hypothetical protein